MSDGREIILDRYDDIYDGGDPPGGDYPGDYPGSPPASSTKAPASSTKAPAPPGPAPSYECGKPVSSRIVGGKEATPFSIPWQVGLVRKGQMDPFCGGTLISPRHVMTAAHCTEPFPQVESIQVVVGEHDISTDSDGVAHDVACKSEHPKYNKPRNSLVYDYSILTLSKPVDITSASSKARVACLPTDTSKLYNKGEKMTVSGWGAKAESGGWDRFPKKLHKITVPGVTNAVCQEDYKKPPQPMSIIPAMMCAGYDEGKIDSCQGDSGGPLTFEQNGKTDLVGVVSFGIGCARSTHYGVYARITSVLPWIYEHGVRENANKCKK